MDNINKNLDFESKVLFVLKELAIRENNELLTDRKTFVEYGSFDAFLPKGIIDIDGPTLLEIKYFEHTVSFKRYLNYGVFNTLIQYVGKGDVRNFLFITNLTISNKEQIKIKNDFQKMFESKKLYIWDIIYLNKITENYPEIGLIYKNKSDKLLTSAIETYIKKPLIKEKKENFERSLISSYRSGSLILVLGAGISSSYGLPEWDELVSIMLETLLKKRSIRYKKEKSSLIKIIKESANYSPLILMRLLKDNLDNRFGPTLYKNLYKNFDPEKRSKLINAIMDLCRPSRNKMALKAVFTFNFDNILELELKRNGIEYVSIYQKDDKIQNDKLSVYHLHGYLPYEKSDITNFNSIVLSEESYHKQFSEPFSWQTFTLLNCLREYTCLFIGTSLTDPNLRRLLEISKNNSPNSIPYIIKPDEWSKKINNNELSAALRFFEENSLRNLGVQVMWVKDYEEVPDILQRIKLGQ